MQYQQFQETLTGIQTKIEEIMASSNEASENKNYEAIIEISSFEKIKVQQNVTQCSICLPPKKVCHKNCAYGNDLDKKKCCAMDQLGHCQLCTHHWTQHQNSHYIYRPVKKKQVKTQQAMKTMFGKAVQRMNGKSTIVYGLLDQQIKIVQKLEQRQEKIRQCDQFLQKYALRKSSYLPTDYLMEQKRLIEIQKQPGWQKYSRNLEYMIQKFDEIKYSMKGQFKCIEQGKEMYIKVQAQLFQQMRDKFENDKKMLQFLHTDQIKDQEREALIGKFRKSLSNLFMKFKVENTDY